MVAHLFRLKIGLTVATFVVRRHFKHSRVTEWGCLGDLHQKISAPALEGFMMIRIAGYTIAAIITVATLAAAGTVLFIFPSDTMGQRLFAVSVAACLILSPLAFTLTKR